MRSTKLNFRVGSTGKLWAILWGFTLAGSVFWPAKEAFSQADALVNINGSNNAQFDMARSVDTACPELVDNSNNNTANQGDLLGVCTNLLVNYFILNPNTNNTLFNDLDSNQDGQLNADDDVFASNPGFGLDEQGLNNALQAMAGEEIQAAQSRLAEVRDAQTQTVFSRIAALRSGQAGGGISLAGLSLDVGDKTHSLHDLGLAESRQMEIIPAAWMEGETWSRLGIFISSSLKVGDKDNTSQADGFDFSSLSFTAGADYRLSDQFVVGGALGYNRFDSDVDETVRSAAGEKLDSDGYLVSAFASYSLEGGMFVDGVASIGQDQYDSTRRIVIPSGTTAPGLDRTASGNFDAYHYGFAANAGYDISYEGFTITPTAKFEYVQAEFDGFSETGARGLNLAFDDFDLKSLRGHLGFEASYSISTDQGIFVPGLRADYVHEFENEDNGAQLIFSNAVSGTNAAYNITTEGIDEDYGIIGASLTAVGANSLSAFIDYSTVVALDNFNIHQLNVGFRWEF